MKIFDIWHPPPLTAYTLRITAVVSSSTILLSCVFWIPYPSKPWWYHFWTATAIPHLCCYCWVYPSHGLLTHCDSLLLSLFLWGKWGLFPKKHQGNLTESFVLHLTKSKLRMHVTHSGAALFAFLTPPTWTFSILRTRVSQNMKSGTKISPTTRPSSYKHRFLGPTLTSRIRFSMVRAPCRDAGWADPCRPVGRWPNPRLFWVHPLLRSFGIMVAYT